MSAKDTYYLTSFANEFKGWKLTLWTVFLEIGKMSNNSKEYPDFKSARPTAINIKKNENPNQLLQALVYCSAIPSPILSINKIHLM